jgi:hypothetical protein
VRLSLLSSRPVRRSGVAKAVERLLPAPQPIMQSEDALEGVQSFMERRKATFKGQ